MTNGKRVVETWRFGALDVLLDRYPQPGASKHVVVLHGPWESAEVLEPIGIALQTVDAGVVIPELPGCGRSAQQPVDEYGRWVDLVVALCAAERERGARDLTLLGVGLGGTLAYYAAARGADVDRLFVTALADPRERALRTRVLGGDWTARLTPVGLHWLAMTGSRRRWLPPCIAARTLCADPELQRRLASDPRCAPEHPVRLLSSFFATAPAVEPEAFSSCPVVLAAPTSDEWLQLEPSLDFYRRLAGDKQLHMLQGSGHLPVDPASANLLARAWAERG